MQNVYNRIETGERLRQRRKELGLSREEIAEKIGRAEKYYADIERGSCGMSLETLIALSNVMGMSIDSIIYGKSFDSRMKERFSNVENEAWLTLISSLNEEKRKETRELLENIIVFSEKS